MKCTHTYEDGRTCWEYCGPVKRRWWQFWIKPGYDLAHWLCNRCDASMKTPVMKVKDEHPPF